MRAWYQHRIVGINQNIEPASIKDLMSLCRYTHALLHQCIADGKLLTSSSQKLTDRVCISIYALSIVHNCCAEPLGSHEWMHQWQHHVLLTACWGARFKGVMRACCQLPACSLQYAELFRSAAAEAAANTQQIIALPCIGPLLP